MKASLLLVLCGWIAATPVWADTVEIYLLKAQDNRIENLDLASEQGHTITYYYLDAQQEIEDMLSKEVEAALSRLFKSLTDELSQAELSALGDDGITQRVMELVATDSEFIEQADVMKSVANDPDIKAGLIRANEDKQRAQTVGVLLHELPAVVFKERKFNNVSDLQSVLQLGGSQ